MIKISLLSQKEHCAKLFQLRDSLGNVCRGQGKASVSCLHGNPKILNLPGWHKHQQSLWTSEDWLRLAGSEQLNSLGSYILTTPALVEVKFTPRSWDTGTQWQHCISKPNTAFSSCYFISPALQATANVTFPARSALAIFLERIRNARRKRQGSNHHKQNRWVVPSGTLRALCSIPSTFSPLCVGVGGTGDKMFYISDWSDAKYTEESMQNPYNFQSWVLMGTSKPLIHCKWQEDWGRKAGKASTLRMAHLVQILLI